LEEPYFTIEVIKQGQLQRKPPVPFYLRGLRVGGCPRTARRGNNSYLVEYMNTQRLVMQNIKTSESGP
jgi:hypothetical protein